MKNLLIRLFVFGSFGVIIYFIILNNAAKPTLIETTTNNVDTITESVEQTESIEVNEEIEVEEEINPILIQGEIKTYSNGDIQYTAEIDSADKITIMRIEPQKANEGWRWMKRQCTYKNNSIKVDWIGTEYTIKSDELIVVENGQTIKYKII